jgi:hypothetical protein
VLRALPALWDADIDLVEGSISRGRSVKVSGDSMVGGCGTRSLCMSCDEDMRAR